MTFIHEMYENGNIAIEELFDINISEKYIYRGNDQLKKIELHFPSATRRHCK